MDNRQAWNYRAYEFWQKYNGSPEEFARRMLDDPGYFLRRHRDYIGEVSGLKLLNALGSNGRKAVPLALLGAEVTVVDISHENARYAKELAQCAGVTIRYIVADFLTFGGHTHAEYFDTAYLEGGILHYFHDLDAFFARLHYLLKPHGKLILSDFHPCRKYIKQEKGQIVVRGDYFDKRLQEGPVAYQNQFPEAEQAEFPQCLLRLWTLSEILNALLRNGFSLERFDESPRWDNAQLPGEFTLVAIRQPV